MKWILVLFLALPALGQTYDWSAVGTSGQLDQGNIFNAGMTGPTLKFRSTATGTLVARYNVTNTFGSATSKVPGWTTLYAAYTDDSANGSVTVKLFKVEDCTDTETLLCTISSSNGANPQCDTCALNSTDVDFSGFSYWVEVTLSRSATSANEQIHSVALN